MFDHQINSVSNEPPLEFRSSAAITRQLEALSSQIAQWLFSNGYVESPEHADLFVTLAWGYPSLLPLPHSLDEKLGPGRLQHWGAGKGVNQPSVDSATLPLP
jgi:hypothetical protein